MSTEANMPTEIRVPLHDLLEDLAAERVKANRVLSRFKALPGCSWTQLLSKQYQDRLRLINETQVQVETALETGKPPFGTGWRQPMPLTPEQEKRQRRMRIYIRGAVREIRAALRNLDEHGKRLDTQRLLQGAGDCVMQTLRLLDEEPNDVG